MRILWIFTFLCIAGMLICAPVDSAPNRLERFQQYFEQVHLSHETIIFLISMVPVFELRGAIPVGILAYHLPWWEVFTLSVVGNIIPILLILWLFDPCRKLLAKLPAFDRFFEWLFQRTRRHSAVIEKYETLGLIIFVAIPLPGTGAWSGAVAAYIFGLPYWKSLLCCFIGVIGAATVVTILTFLGWIGAAIALVGFLALVVLPMLNLRRKNHVA